MHHVHEHSPQLDKFLSAYKNPLFLQSETQYVLQYVQQLLPLYLALFSSLNLPDLDINHLYYSLQTQYCRLHILLPAHLPKMYYQVQ